MNDVVVPANDKPEEIFRKSAFTAMEAVIGQPKFSASLYHYTSSDGLLGIIKSNTLRFSDTRFVNDGSEVFYGLSVFEHVLAQFTEGMSEADQSAADNLKETVRDQLVSFPSFIFCLSEENNLLNQWRDYGKDVVTYSIELDTATMLSQDYFNFSAVLFKLIYKRDQQEAIMRELLTRLYDRYKALGEVSDVALPLVKYAAAYEITWLIHLFKNPAFEAEKEWRFTTWEGQLKEGAAEPDFRPSSLGVVPYYDWKRKGEDTRLPIKSVTVGPSPYAHVADLALKTFLRKKGYTDNTFYSQIPIRR